MSISSRNTFADTLRIMFDQTPQSNWHINLVSAGIQRAGPHTQRLGSHPRLHFLHGELGCRVCSAPTVSAVREGHRPPAMTTALEHHCLGPLRALNGRMCGNAAGELFRSTEVKADVIPLIFLWLSSIRIIFMFSRQK